MKLGLLIDSCKEMKLDPYEFDLISMVHLFGQSPEGGIVNEVDYDEEHKCIRLIYAEPKEPATKQKPKKNKKSKKTLK